jgi:hypothetical protein
MGKQGTIKLRKIIQRPVFIDAIATFSGNWEQGTPHNNYDNIMILRY